MQESSIDIIWQIPEIGVGENKILQLFLNFIFENLGAHLKEYAGKLASSTGQNERLFVNTGFPGEKELFLFMTCLPQLHVRKYLMAKVNKLFKDSEYFSDDDVGSNPPFYPQILYHDQSHFAHISDKSIDEILSVSRAINLYYRYSADYEYFMSEGFTTQLMLSRFWSAFLDQRNSILNPAFIKDINVEAENTALETLLCTMELIGILKSEFSWIYEDLRERNKFSEIKEVASWRKWISADEEKSGNSKDTGAEKSFGIERPGGIKLIEKLTLEAENFQKGSLGKATDLTYLSTVWTDLILSLTGIDLRDDRLFFNPYLPEKWKFFSFNLQFRDKVLSISLKPGEMQVSETPSRGSQERIYPEKILLKTSGPGEIPLLSL